MRSLKDSGGLVGGCKGLQVLGNRLNKLGVKMEREGKLTGSGGKRNNKLINFAVVMQVCGGCRDFLAKCPL